jgi:uncharacterized protein (DUF1330 family)
MSAYILAMSNITDAKKYNNEFMPAAKKAHAAYDIKTVAVSNAPHQMLTGTPRVNHVVILQAQDEAHARAFFNSPEMQTALAIGESCMAELRVGIIPAVSGLVEARAAE